MSFEEFSNRNALWFYLVHSLVCLRGVSCHYGEGPFPFLLQLIEFLGHLQWNLLSLLIALDNSVPLLDLLHFLADLLLLLLQFCLPVSFQVCESLILLLQSHFKFLNGEDHLLIFLPKSCILLIQQLDLRRCFRFDILQIFQHDLQLSVGYILFIIGLMLTFRCSNGWFGGSSIGCDIVTLTLPWRG